VRKKEGGERGRQGCVLPNGENEEKQEKMMGYDFHRKKPLDNFIAIENWIRNHERKSAHPSATKMPVRLRSGGADR